MARSVSAVLISFGSITVEGGMMRTRGTGLGTISGCGGIAGNKERVGLVVGGDGDRKAGWMCR